MIICSYNLMVQIYNVFFELSSLFDNIFSIALIFICYKLINSLLHLNSGDVFFVRSPQPKANMPSFGKYTLGAGQLISFLF